jgi:ABC-type uncharacterized transport system auxiliary subunit
VTNPMLLGCMNQTLSVYTPQTSTSAGSPFGIKDFAASTARTYSCRYTERAGFVRLNNGQVAEYTSVAWVDSTGNITVQDKVAMPSGSGELPIVSVETLHDETGAVDHQVLKWAR